MQPWGQGFESPHLHQPPAAQLSRLSSRLGWIYEFDDVKVVIVLFDNRIGKIPKIENFFWMTWIVQRRFEHPRRTRRKRNDVLIEFAMSKFYGQATKGTRWMPRRVKAMKDVVSCDKPGRGANNP